MIVAPVARRCVESPVPLSRSRGLARFLASQRDNVAPSVRVITYNVLAPQLCNLDRFPHCKPEDLESDVRWMRLREKIRTALSSTTPTVVCLQEIGEEWAYRFQVFFHELGYHFSYSMTPNFWYKPMGVAMAWPINRLGVEEISCIHVGAAVGSPTPAVEPTYAERLLGSMTLGMLGRRKRDYDAGSVNFVPWVKAAQRQNRALAVRFQVGDSDRKVVVATYHMPCLFGEPVRRQAKAIHAAILRQQVVEFSGKSEIVLAGDFNTTPGDTELDLVMTGQLQNGESCMPPSVDGFNISKWVPNHSAQETCELDAVSDHVRLRSAYADAIGRELEYTCYAWIKDHERPFRDTLDYVFVSPGLKVTGVIETDNVEDGAPPFPTEDQPSDHLLLGADLQFV